MTPSPAAAPQEGQETVATTGPEEGAWQEQNIWGGIPYHSIRRHDDIQSGRSMAQSRQNGLRRATGRKGKVVDEEIVKKGRELPAEPVSAIEHININLD